MKRSLALLIAISACCTQLLWGKDVIIESCPGGQNRSQYQELGGKWIDSKTPPQTAKSSAPGLSPQNGCGTRKTLLSGQYATARFLPKFDAPGHYYVYATWPRASNAKDVLFVVNHAAGQTTKTLTQDGWGMTGAPNANRWISLGDYDFKPGDEQYVEVQITPETQPTDTSQTGQAYADSVSFTSAAMVNTGEAGGAPKPVVPAVADLVVEARKEGKNSDKYKEMAGVWINSGDAQGHGKSRAPGLSDATQVGTRKVLCGADAKAENRNQTAAARFTPNFPSPGHYYVYVTWPREANAQPITYKIKHASGEDVKELSQDGWGATGPSNADMWVLVGEYDFAPGEDQYVELSMDGSKVAPLDRRNRCQVYADAIRFSTTKLENRGNSPISSMIAKAAQPSPSTMAPASTPPVLIPAGTSAPSAMAGGAIQWVPDIEAAQKEAAKSNKRILIFFFTPESNLSRAFENEIFSNSEVQSVINSMYVPVKVNFSENNSVAYALQVYRAGTVMLYDSTGRFLKKIDERKSASDFAAELKK